MKSIRRAAAVILSAVLCLMPLSPAFAQSPDVAQDCPYIFIHGFMGSTVYVDPSDPDSEPAWPPSGDAIKEAVKKALPALGALLITHNYQRFADKVFPVVDELFKPIMLGPDGEVPDKSGGRWSYPPAESITKSSRLSYVYDWRISPIETAEGLADFIDYVLECSGADDAHKHYTKTGDAGVFCNIVIKKCFYHYCYRRYLHCFKHCLKQAQGDRQIESFSVLRLTEIKKAFEYLKHLPHRPLHRCALST